MKHFYNIKYYKIRFENLQSEMRQYENRSLQQIEELEVDVKGKWKELEELKKQLIDSQNENRKTNDDFELKFSQLNAASEFEVKELSETIQELKQKFSAENKVLENNLNELHNIKM